MQSICTYYYNRGHFTVHVPLHALDKPQLKLHLPLGGRGWGAAAQSQVSGCGLLSLSLVSWPCWCWLPIQAEAVAVHYAENVIGCSWSSGSKQLRLMLNRDSSSSSSSSLQSENLPPQSAAAMPSASWKIEWKELSFCSVVVRNWRSIERCDRICLCVDKDKLPSYKCQAIAAQKAARQGITVAPLPRYPPPVILLTSLFTVWKCHYRLACLQLHMPLTQIQPQLQIQIHLQLQLRLQPLPWLQLQLHLRPQTPVTVAGHFLPWACSPWRFHSLLCLYFFLCLGRHQNTRQHTLTTTAPTYIRFDTQSAGPSLRLPKIRHISSSKLCLPVRGILCFLLLPVAWIARSNVSFMLKGCSYTHTHTLAHAHTLAHTQYKFADR